MKKITILFFIIFLSQNYSIAQKVSSGVSSGVSTATIRSQILEGETFRPVSFANVLSLKTKEGTICGFDGFFNLPLDITDTLVVSAIGFEKEFVIVSSIAKSDGSYEPIRLMTRTYHITAVNIYELRWQKFKDEFIAEKMPKWAGNKYYWMESMLNPEELEEIRNMPIPGVGFAVGLTTTYYQKQLAKVAHLEAQAKVEKKIAEKFNPQIIAELTKLKDEELVDFIVYCDFSELFLLNAETQIIISQIKSNFKQYQYDKKNGNLPDYHPINRVYRY